MSQENKTGKGRKFNISHQLWDVLFIKQYFFDHDAQLLIKHHFIRRPVTSRRLYKVTDTVLCICLTAGLQVRCFHFPGPGMLSAIVTSLMWQGQTSEVSTQWSEQQGCGTGMHSPCRCSKVACSESMHAPCRCRKVAHIQNKSHPALTASLSSHGGMKTKCDLAQEPAKTLSGSH